MKIIRLIVQRLARVILPALAMTFVITAHNMRTTRSAIVDEAVVIHRGMVVEQGGKTEVLEPPHPEYTGLLLASVPEMDPDWLPHVAATRTTATTA